MSGRWTGAHWGAVGLCLAVFVAAGLVAVRVFEQVVHLEDEVAYLFQAQVFAAGRAYVEAPFHTNCFFAPFVLDHQGRRFSKYTPGWPALLAIGVRLGQPWWVNAACAALTVALTFRLGREVSGPWVGTLAAALATASPFVLILAGSLMSHTACLTFTTAFLWCFRRAWATERVPPEPVSSIPRGTSREGWALAAGVALGCAFIIRPYTTFAVALPAGLCLLWRLFRKWEWKPIWFLGLGFVPLALLIPVFNAIWTGDPLLSPYLLFWSYDRIGFGPGHGPLPEGNTLWMGLGEAVWVVGRLANWLHGWPALSLTFVILGFLFRPRRFVDLFLAGTALTLVLAYVLYWTNGDVYGPRYTHEATSALLVLSATGLVRVGLWAQKKGVWPLRALCVVWALLVVVDLSVYLPWQFRQYRGLFGITARPREILKQADLHDALVIVTTERGWKDYAVAFSMNVPTLDGDVVYASECGALTERLLEQFPGRAVYLFDGHSVQPWGDRRTGGSDEQLAGYTVFAARDRPSEKGK